MLRYKGSLVSLKNFSLSLIGNIFPPAESLLSAEGPQTPVAGRGGVAGFFTPHAQLSSQSLPLPLLEAPGWSQGDVGGQGFPWARCPWRSGVAALRSADVSSLRAGPLEDFVLTWGSPAAHLLMTLLLAPVLHRYPPRIIA